MDFIAKNLSRFANSISKSTSEAIASVAGNILTTMIHVAKKPRTQILMSQVFLCTMLLWSPKALKATTISNYPDKRHETDGHIDHSVHDGIRGATDDKADPLTLFDKSKCVFKCLTRRLWRSNRKFLCRIQRSTHFMVHKFCVYFCLVFTAWVATNVIMNYEITLVEAKPKIDPKSDCFISECRELVAKYVKKFKAKHLGNK